MSSSKEIKEGYASTLQDLTFNSKPLINVLTMLAEENSSHASDIVEVIESYLQKVRLEVKLPVLYLIDCIMKNVGDPYTTIFCQNLVSTFCTVFEMVDERTRAEMFKLRQTWNDIIPSKKLYSLDVQINLLDPAWPVTAPAPTSSIYFNPKFLKNNGPGSNKKGMVPKPDLITSQTTLDPATLDMQKKLIQKQQELIELQQKKVELELLQTQVKLQEQLKSQNIGNEHSGPTNIHLKPEVAKSLNMPVGSSNNILMAKSKLPSVPSAIKQRLPGNHATTKIHPVSGNLATARAIKDPRLLRHQTASLSNNINSNINIENKNLIPQSVDSKDVVNCNKNVRDSRLANNKDNPLLDQQGKAKSLPRIPKMSKNTDTYKPTTKSSSSSTSSRSKSDSSKSSSSGSFGSPSKKSDSKSRSPMKSSISKQKKVSPKTEKKSEKAVKKSLEKDSKSPQKAETSPTAFKALKGQKNRNYSQRNRAISISPEPTHDIDLRLCPPEKMPRLQGDPNDKSSKDSATTASQGMDVDLRTLPDVSSKKRTSTDVVDIVPAKKSKNEIMDALFGAEDTDLRIIPNVSPTKVLEKPSTPPPPIISDKMTFTSEVNKENKKDLPKNKVNLDLVRAKLANATNKDKLLDNDKTNNQVPDIDLRNLLPFSNNNSKIFISPAEEHNIKSGNMTKAQETALVTKIIAQLENHKLMEAKRKDRSEIENFANTSLQPISDEEFDAADSEPEEDYRGMERNPPPPPNLNQGPDFGKFNHRRGDMIRGPWRGRRGRGLPLPRPGIRGPRGPEPWMRPPAGANPGQGPWRPMLHPAFPKQHNMNDNYMGDMDYEQGGHSPLNHDSQDSQPNIIVNSANQDNNKSINIDGTPRDIRYYDETAVAFMNWDDPREISFHNGSRRVTFDDKESYILNFNEPDREVTINGNAHRVRLGGPTREIYIDGIPYECYFGGPGIGVELVNRVVSVKMDGPPPQVRIGSLRKDLVGGKINFIVDAKNVIPIFLDGRVQNFVLDGKTHTLQFTDALRTALINDTPFKVEFGGLPKPFVIDDNKHFIRFSVLPNGIKPGYVNIKDMKGSRISSPVNENSQDSMPAIDTNEPALPIINKKKTPIGAASPDHNSNSSMSFQNLLQPNLSHLDVLSNVMSSTLTSNPTVSGYSVGNAQQLDSNSQDSSMHSASLPQPATTPVSFNINDLFQKLVATGIVTTMNQEKQPTAPVVHPQNKTVAKPQNVIKNKSFKPAYFDKPETLKVRQPSLIQSLHSGMQCSSCGMRFPPELTKQYSQHLDWHFRQNRKGKKNIRKAASRRWYYGIDDWKNYEEVEDLEDKEKNYFDQQQAQVEGANNDEEEDVEIPSVVADRAVIDPRCEVCQDKFEQFYNEEKEEWHLRMAMRVEGKTFHPLCYDDYLASLEAEDDSTTENGIPGLDTAVHSLGTSPERPAEPEEIVIDDDEDESASVVKKDEEPAKEPEETKESNGETPMEQDDDDDDVIIHEVIPERIVLDDDDAVEDDEVVNGDDDMPKPAAVKEEPIDDGFMDVGEGIMKFDTVKIKTEPIDQDESVMELSLDDKEEEIVKVSADTTHSDFVPLIDGNVQFESGALPPSGGLSGKIKINITKPIPVLTSRDTNKELASNDIDNTSPEILDPSQPLPPGEECKLKPALQGLKLNKRPPVEKGVELTGLCSIM